VSAWKVWEVEVEGNALRTIEAKCLEDIVACVRHSSTRAILSIRLVAQAAFPIVPEVAPPVAKLNGQARPEIVGVTVDGGKVSGVVEESSIAVAPVIPATPRKRGPYKRRMGNSAPVAAQATQAHSTFIDRPDQASPLGLERREQEGRKPPAGDSSRPIKPKPGKITPEVSAMHRGFLRVWARQQEMSELADSLALTVEQLEPLFAMWKSAGRDVASLIGHLPEGGAQ